MKMNRPRGKQRFEARMDGKTWKRTREKLGDFPRKAFKSYPVGGKNAAVAINEEKPREDCVLTVKRR